MMTFWELKLHDKMIQWYGTEWNFLLTVRMANRIVGARDVRGSFIDAKEMQKNLNFLSKRKKKQNFTE